MKAVTVLAFDMGQVVESGDNEIDRNEIDASTLNADAGYPRRQQLPHFLNQLEEVVGAIDLIHLAGIGIADDKTRPVNSPWNPALITHNLFSFVLAGEIWMFQIFGFVEHVLTEHASIKAGCGD